MTYRVGILKDDEDNRASVYRARHIGQVFIEERTWLGLNDRPLSKVRSVRTGSSNDWFSDRFQWFDNTVNSRSEASEIWGYYERK